MKDMTSQRIGSYLVIERRGRSGTHIAWLCRCDCGTFRILSGALLRNGDCTDCGCVSYRPHPGRAPVHGMTNSPEWRAWSAMIDRCTRPAHKAWKWYGGRGIMVCARWLTSFSNFYADMGPRPKGMSLDRIDTDKGYTPENCRWASQKAQQNNRRSNVRITIDGESRTMKEWAEHFGIKYSVVKARHASGISGLALFAASPRKQYRRLVEIDGQKKTITDWAKHYGIPYIEMWKRLRESNPTNI